MDTDLPQGEVTVAREYDLPPVVVWDALTDPVLLEGWLGACTSAAEVGGAFLLEWLDPHHHGAALAGEIAVLEEGSRLLVRALEYALALAVDELPGGSRGTSSRVTLSVRLPADGHSEAEQVAHWRTHLEALEDLLRGHPVAWERWDADYGQTTRDLLGRPHTTAR